MTRLLAILLAILSLTARGYELTTVQACSTNALTLVFYSCGWTASEKANFLRFVTNAAGTINGQSWTAGYSNRIKILAVMTNDPNSGIDGNTSDNSYTTYGGYITAGNSCRIDVAKLGAVKTAAGLDELPAIVVLNVGNYAGTTISIAAGMRLVMTTNAEVNILAHELGHYVPGMDYPRSPLADEYTGGTDFALTNAAASLSAATNQWLTEFPSLYPPVSRDGGYVPTSTCKMDNVSNPFCLVCSNQLSRALFSIAGISSGGGSSPYIPPRPSFLNFGTLRIGNP